MQILYTKYTLQTSTKNRGKYVHALDIYRDLGRRNKLIGLIDRDLTEDVL